MFVYIVLREVDHYAKSLLSDSEIAGMGAECLLENTEGCDSDFMIARMMQMQFDKEHDEVLKKTEAKFNGTSKGKEKKLLSIILYIDANLFHG